MEHLFSPNSSTDLRSDAHQSQIIGGDADEDHAQIVGGRRIARNSQLGGCFGGLEAEPPALENLAFFCKNNFILGLF